MAHTEPIDAGTRLAGILGHPVAHSLSPLIHNTAFRAQGLNCRYVALPARPQDLPAAVFGLRALGFMGANVTLPHKQAALALMDEISDNARVVGAVNTIVCRNGTLVGDNTDVYGFTQPLLRIERDLRGRDTVLLGAGGGARAVAFGLLQRFAPRTLTLVARTPARAEKLAEDLACRDPNGSLRVVPTKEAGPSVRACRLLVNCTPVGMHPCVDGTPWPDADDFGAGQIVYDLVYRPVVTRLLREAHARGARTLGGLDMLLHQAAAAYRQWTGATMPLEPVRRAVRRAAYHSPHPDSLDP